MGGFECDWDCVIVRQWRGPLRHRYKVTGFYFQHAFGIHATVRNSLIFPQIFFLSLSPHHKVLRIYSCCSHLEDRASMKLFVLLQLLNVRQSVGSVGLLGRGISPSEGLFLTQSQNKRSQTHIPWVGFELTIPAFERAKTCHALDHAATVIGSARYGVCIFLVRRLEL
jgi:hypothetical protein